MGISESVPGINTSTIAMILGIYDKFFNFLHGVTNIIKAALQLFTKKISIKELKKELSKVDIKFGLLIFLGIIISIASISHIIGLLLNTIPQYIYALFFGIILGAISIPWNNMRTKGLKEIFVLLTTFILFFIILGLKPITMQENPTLLLLFLGGALSISTMGIPAVNTSFILLILGLYEYIFSVIKNFTKLQISSNDLINITVFCLGLFVGFVLFIRLTKYLLDKFHSIMMAFIMGIMIASLRLLWPFVDPNTGENFREMQKVLPWNSDIEKLVLTFIIIIVTAILTSFLTSRTKKHKHSTTP